MVLRSGKKKVMLPPTLPGHLLVSLVMLAAFLPYLQAFLALVTESTTFQRRKKAVFERTTTFCGYVYNLLRFFSLYLAVK